MFTFRKPLQNAVDIKGVYIFKTMFSSNYNIYLWKSNPLSNISVDSGFSTIVLNDVH